MQRRRCVPAVATMSARKQCGEAPPARMACAVGRPRRARIGVAAAVALFVTAGPAHGDGSPAPLSLSPRVSATSYFAQHSQRVEAALLRFSASLAPEEQQRRVDIFRDRDRLRLWHATGTLEPPSAAIGVALFAAAVVFTAHTPERLRPLVESRVVHLGPSISDTGGVGVAVGGKF